MRRMRTKGWVLVMLGTVGIALLGLAYAMWGQQMQIEGVIAMDSMDLNYDKAFTDDDEKVDNPDKDVDDVSTGCDPDDPNNAGCDPAATGPDHKDRYEFDVAFCQAAIDNLSTGGKISIHVTDAYPSYHCTSWFDLDNDSTIPVKLDAVKLNGTEVTPTAPGVWPMVPVDPDQDGDEDGTVQITELERCKVIDVAETIQGDVDLHVLNGADEDEVWSYEVELIFVNWNEDTANCPYPAP